MEGVGTEFVEFLRGGYVAIRGCLPEMRVLIEI